jgi:hypothetical protein
MVPQLLDGVRYRDPDAPLPPTAGDRPIAQPQASGVQAAFKAWASLGK